jgi:hypothetical protein
MLVSSSIWIRVFCFLFSQRQQPADLHNFERDFLTFFFADRGNMHEADAFVPGKLSSG